MPCCDSLLLKALPTPTHCAGIFLPAYLLNTRRAFLSYRPLPLGVFTPGGHSSSLGWHSCAGTLCLVYCLDAFHLVWHALLYHAPLSLLPATLCGCTTTSACCTSASWDFSTSTIHHTTCAGGLQHGQDMPAAVPSPYSLPLLTCFIYTSLPVVYSKTFYMLRRKNTTPFLPTHCVFSCVLLCSLATLVFLLESLHVCTSCHVTHVPPSWELPLL